MNLNLDYDRISYLLNPEQFKDIKITVIGLGSGGAPAVDHLTMNGFRNWDLYDHDILEPVNLVKHPRMRKDLGRLKVDIQKEWILDRNPDAKVNTYPENVLQSENFINSIKTSDLILSCPDLKIIREFISDKCVEHQKPFVTASVFRTGIGGEIYSYIPNETGCYRCLNLHLMNNNAFIPDDAFGLTDEEEEKIYGLGEKDFQASGLSVDIQTISLIQVRMAMSVLLRNFDTSIPKMNFNWIVYGIRPKKGIFNQHFDIRKFNLKPQKACNCSNK